MNYQLNVFCCFTTKFYIIVISLVLAHTSSVRGHLDLDFSNLKDPENLRRAEHYAASSMFDAHSTAVFSLRMNKDTMSRLGIREGELPSLPSRLENPITRHAFVEAVLRNVSKPLLPDGQELLYAMLIGPLQTTVVTLQPSDDQFEELMLFLQAYKSFWNYMGEETVPRVENQDSEYKSSMVRSMVKQFEATKSQRSPRKFSPMEASFDNLRHLSTNVFNVPRNQVVDRQNATAVRVYVRQEFEALGLLVMEHSFASFETDVKFGDRLEGTNLVALLPGSRFKTRYDRPVVVGAHIDTVVGSPGYDDNGSGMTALVEAARMISTSGCEFENTIVFVAFDLEEMGTQGSMMFVKDFVPRVLGGELGMDRISGALVLDCIGNWDPEPGSQDLPEGWHDYLPRFVQRLQTNDRKGDFISLIYRNGVDSFLANRFSSYYSRLEKPEYRLEALAIDGLGPQLPPGASLKKHFDVLRSDHVRFWYPRGERETGLNETIPAVLITDTGPYRGRLRKCYHSPCDVHVAGREEDVSFIAKTTEALVWTVADLAGGQCGPRGRLGVRQLFRITSSFLPPKKTSEDQNNNAQPAEANGQSPPTGNDDFTEVGGTKHETALDSDLTSLTNALEMLHFLGVVPSIAQLTERQLRTPRRSQGRRRSKGVRVFKKKLPPNYLLLTSAERRGVS
ncbi:Peptidase M28 [Trinorchestia longiramus]|nr:Peptidase M28 [Trinorchestia longiramus]